MAGPRDLLRRGRAAALGLTVGLAVALAGVGHVPAQDETPTPATHGEHGHHGEMTAEPTAAERAAAERLVAETKAGAARFADPAVAAAAGYVQVTPFSFYGVPAAHFHNEAYNRDGRLLDPERPEDLMYLKTPDGRLVLIGVMYLAPPGEGPPVGGPLTQWHAHDDLCAARGGVVPVDPTGSCPPRSVPITQEMLHVWLVDNPHGPFADFLPAEGSENLGADPTTGGLLAAGASLVNWRGLMVEVGDLLGLSPIQIQRRFAAGESLAEMAAAQAVDRDDLEEVITRRLIADLEHARAEDLMTTAQLDLLRRVLPMQVERMVEIHQGEPWLTNSPTPTPTPTPAAAA